MMEVDPLDSVKVEDISDEESALILPYGNEPIKGTFHQLPLKSRVIYEKVYKTFINWCSSENVKAYTEDVLLRYFAKESEQYKATSLWAHYSMIKACLDAKENTDISGYRRLLAFLKQQMQGYTPKKSRTFSREQIMQFVSEAPDDLFLAVKVGLIFGIAGACRNDEMTSLRIDDLEDLGSALVVTIRSPEQKINRVFTVVDNKESSIKFLDIIRKYIQLRPPHTPHRRFFLFYRNGKCSTQVMGKNTIGGLGAKIATFLKLPEPHLYTGHCLRQSSITVLSGRSKRKTYGNGVWQSATISEGFHDALFEGEYASTSRNSPLNKTNCIECDEDDIFFEETTFSSTSKSTDTPQETTRVAENSVSKGDSSFEESSSSSNCVIQEQNVTSPSITIRTIQVPEQTDSQNENIVNNSANSLPQITIKTVRDKCGVSVAQSGCAAKTTNVSVVCHQESSSQVTIKTIPSGVVITGCKNCHIEVNVT